MNDSQFAPSKIADSEASKEKTVSNKSMDEGVKIYIPQESDDKLSILKNEAVQLEKSFAKQSGFLNNILNSVKVCKFPNL